MILTFFDGKINLALRTLCWDTLKLITYLYIYSLKIQYIHTLPCTVIYVPFPIQIEGQIYTYFTVHHFLWK